MFRLKVLNQLSLESISDGSALWSMGDPVVVFPGVRGLTVRRRDVISVVFILSMEEGKGNVSRYIDHLKETYSVVRFPNLISEKLQNMLVKRGFECVIEWDAFCNGITDVYVWRKPK